MDKLKVVTLNVKGLNNPIKRKRVLQNIKKEGGEICFIQETHLTQLEHKKLEKLASAQVFAASFTTARRGVAILIKKSCMFMKEKCIIDKEGRFVLVTGELEGQYITLMNVYNPPGEHKDCLNKIVELLITETKGIAIMGGDFNMVMNPKEDTRSKIKHKSNQTAKLMKKAEHEFGLIDVWRNLHPRDRAYTFYSEAHKVYSRLDYFFMFKTDIPRVLKCEIYPIAISDHAMVTLEINLRLNRGETLWRMNNSLLGDKDFTEKIRSDFKAYLELNDNKDVTDITLWEAGKVTLRGEIIAYSSWKKKQRLRERKMLEIKIKQLQEKHQAMLSKDSEVQLKETRKALEILEQEEFFFLF